MYDCVISRDEVFQVTVTSESGTDLQLVCRVGDLEEDVDDAEDAVDEEHDIDMPDCYRGRITAETVLTIKSVLCITSTHLTV
jgi:hypothetical protein